MDEMDSDDGFEMINAGGMDGDFVIPLNERFEHCVWNQDFSRRVFFESVKAAKDWKRVKFLEKKSFRVISGKFL